MKFKKLDKSFSLQEDFNGIKKYYRKFGMTPKQGIKQQIRDNISDFTKDIAEDNTIASFGTGMQIPGISSEGKIALGNYLWNKGANSDNRVTLDKALNEMKMRKLTGKLLRESRKARDRRAISEKDYQKDRDEFLENSKEIGSKIHDIAHDITSQGPVKTIINNYTGINPKARMIKSELRDQIRKMKNK